MQGLRYWLLVALVPLISGCLPVVYSEEPLGDVVALKPEEWNGSWVFGGPETASVETIRTIDAATGVISGSDGCERAPADAQKEELIQLRRFAESKWYFPLPGKRDAKGEFAPKEAPPFEYLMLYFRPSPSSWLAYLVAQDRITRLVEQGALPGRVDGKKVILGRLSPEHYEMLLSEERPLVQWQEPLAVVKLPPALDPCRTGEPAK